MKVTIDAVRRLHERDYYSGERQVFPVGLAELGLPAIAPPTPAAVPTRCLAGLLSIDGTPIDVSVSGTTAAALDGNGLALGGCGNSANGITLSAGTHVLSTTPYEGDGLTLDALSLSSAAGGIPAAPHRGRPDPRSHRGRRARGHRARPGAHARARLGRRPRLPLLARPRPVPEQGLARHGQGRPRPRPVDA